MLRYVVLPALLCCTTGFAAENGVPAGPLSQTFTMVIKDVERTFVEHGGSSYLLTKADDFTDHTFLTGKDVLITGKFQRGQGERVWIYKPDDLEVHASPELWSAKVDGDNLYLFGHMTWDADQNHPVLKVVDALPAPSDTQYINDRLANIAKTDWDARIKVANLVREQGTIQGNPDWWLQQSDTLLTHIIADAAALAESTKDVALLNKAVGWSIDVQKDPVGAAHVASAGWIKGIGGKDAVAIALRMRRLGMEQYRDQWHPRAEAQEMEFEDRFNALTWRDAEGFYRLGRWADANAESLPQAKDRAYRAYQAGLKADPDHPGIRRELGLDLNTGESAMVEAGESRSEYHDPSTNVVVRSPSNWRRGEGAREGIRWEDPTSDTAYIAVRFLDISKTTISDAWSLVTTRPRALHNFSVVAQTAPAEHTVGKLVYSYTEDNLSRMAAIYLDADTATQTAAVIEGSFVEEEKDKVAKALEDVVAHVAFPKTKSDKPAPVTAPTAAPGPAPTAGPAPATANVQITPDPPASPATPATR